jgi:hypothetical protein
MPSFRVNYGARVVEQYRASGISTKGLDVREELVADIMRDSFTDPKFWDAIAQDHPSLFKRWAAAPRSCPQAQVTLTTALPV